MKQSWQPGYLKSLPPLPVEELQVIPLSGKIRRSNRSLMLTQWEESRK
jgi:hypothetical protein